MGKMSKTRGKSKIFFKGL